MITKEQYEAAKRIVEEYERDEYEQGMIDAEDESDPFEEEYTNCTCGAYVLGKNGGVLHVSDCYCGAG